MKKITLILFLTLINGVAHAEWKRDSAAKAKDFEISFEMAGAETYKLLKETKSKDASYFVEIDYKNQNWNKPSNPETFQLLEQTIRVLVEKERKKGEVKVCSRKATVTLKAEGKEILKADICLDQLTDAQNESLTEWIKFCKMAAHAHY